MFIFMVNHTSLEKVVEVKLKHMMTIRETKSHPFNSPYLIYPLAMIYEVF